MFHLPALPAMEDKTNSPEVESAPSWFNNFVNKFFKGHQPDTPQSQNKPLNHSTTQMKKDYQKVNSILKIEGVEVDKDGKVTLTEDQVKALNDRIANLEQESSDKDSQISDLKSRMRICKSRMAKIPPTLMVTKGTMMISLNSAKHKRCLTT